MFRDFVMRMNICIKIDFKYRRYNWIFNKIKWNKIKMYLFGLLIYLIFGL